MSFSNYENITEASEPNPLGVDIDSASLDVFGNFFDSLIEPFNAIYGVWLDGKVTSPTVRQHVIAILTAPRGAVFTFNNPDEGITKLKYARDPSEGMNKHLSLRARLESRPQLIQELATGILYWLDNNRAKDLVGSKQFNISMSDYQRTIAEILPLVTSPIADRLFAHYPIYDDEHKWNIASEPGFHQMTRIIDDAGIPLRYREAVLDKWIQATQTEPDADQSARAEANILRANLAAFAVSMKSAHDAIGQHLHRRIVNHLEEIHPDSEPYFSQADLRIVASKLSYDSDLRLNVVLRHFCYQGPVEKFKFQINNLSDEEFARGVILEAHVREIFGPIDHISEMLDEFREFRVKSLARLAEKLALRDALRNLK